MLFLATCNIFAEFPVKMYIYLIVIIAIFTFLCIIYVYMMRLHEFNLTTMKNQFLLMTY